MESNNVHLLKEQMLDAIKKDELVFFYQPEWDFKTGRIVAIEALMRWQDKKRGLVPPLEFIPKWEKAGLLPTITEFLFERPLRDLKKLHKLGFSDLTVAINVSASQLNAAFVPTVQKVLRKSGIPASKVECELTESMPLTNIKQINRFNALSKLGIQLTVDDYGAGCWTPEILSHLKINKLKIDRSLLSPEYPDNTIPDIVEMGHKSGYSVLIEGIDNPKQLNQRTQDADAGQGFLVARPLPLSDLITFLKENPMVQFTRKLCHRNNKLALQVNNIHDR